ncbi:MAG: phosphatidate cytidylyltransferase [Candidatus Binatia bacterium]|nr:MAG: phosphatidate cytidylyltransferase [Candidatus Binatia bacterium]
MLRARLATAAVAIPLLLVVIFAPVSWPLATVVFVAGLLGAAEIANMAFPRHPAEQILVVALTALVLAAAWMGPDTPWLALALTTDVCLGLTWVLLRRSDFEAALRDLGLALLGALYVGLLLPHFLWLHRLPGNGPYWVVFVLAIGMIGDTTGYFVGKYLGRHQLAPLVSPKKTVEGAVGIVAASVLTGVVCHYVILREVPLNHILFLSTTMGVIGQIGDLCESLFKRAFGVKDSGWIFPGHGGVLDRIDSLLFPAAFVYYHEILLRGA